MERRFSGFPLVGILVALSLGAMDRACAEALSPAQALEKASRLHMALTGGVPFVGTNPKYNEILSRTMAKDYLGAASLVTDEDEFLNNVVAALPQTMNVDGTAVGDRNEMSAMFLVTARDNRPVRDLVTADFTAYDPSNTPKGIRYAIDDSQCTVNTGNVCNSSHFRAVWSSTNPRQALKTFGHPGFPGIGIFTSYPWADNYVRAGTGRRNIRGVNENLFCTLMDGLRDPSIPDIRIRQDIPRDDPNYRNDCVRCHGWMDDHVAPWLALEIDPVSNVFRWLSPIKDRINDYRGPNYPVTSPAFNFFFSENQNSVYGIEPSRLPVQSYNANGVKVIPGVSLSEYGNIVANSKGFYRCLVTRIVAQIYMKKSFSFAIFNKDDFETIKTQADSINTFADLLMEKQDLADIYRRIAVWYWVED